MIVCFVYFCLILQIMYSYFYFYALFLCLCIIVMYVLFCRFCFHCVVLSIVCVQMCTVLLPPGVNPIAVNKYIV